MANKKQIKLLDTVAKGVKPSHLIWQERKKDSPGYRSNQEKIRMELEENVHILSEVTANRGHVLLRYP